MPIKRISKSKAGVSQAEMRRGIAVGPGLREVSPVAYWYKSGGHFKNEDEARGAFYLAHQQGMDGMGVSVANWMGLTTEQFRDWCRDSALPAKNKIKKRIVAVQ
jgi:hypothetical protein